jgi:hypothetical protein
MDGTFEFSRPHGTLSQWRCSGWPGGWAAAFAASRGAVLRLDYWRLPYSVTITAQTGITLPDWQPVVVGVLLIIGLPRAFEASQRGRQHAGR